MRRLTRATIALPLAVVLAGILIPLLVGRHDDVGGRGVEEAPAKIQGRTAAEWEAASMEAAGRGDFNLALRRIKTAERVDPGVQYSESLNMIRRARWRHGQVAELRDRLLSGSLEGMEFDNDGSVLAGFRTVVVLPGESLWSLARAFVAAERGVLPGDIPQRDQVVYQEWDQLVELNGLRELEVGERVVFPLNEQDIVAVEASNRADLSRIRQAMAALDSGDLSAAESTLGGVTTAFGLCSEAFRQARDACDLARELDLVEGARGAMEALAAVDRDSDHARRLELIDRASAGIARAEQMRTGLQYADARELIDRLSLEERRYEVQEDGTVVAVKPAGESYTGVARDALEWALQRPLVSSGSAFPNSHLKSDDERAWARYLMLARRAAESEGADFAQLLSTDAEVVIHLPRPASCFSD